MARQWYRLAAEQGHVSAQFNLGRLMQEKNVAESWLHGMERRRQAERPRPFR